MGKPLEIASQLKSLCDLLHQFEGLDQRQLRRIETRDFYNAFAKSILAGDAPKLAGHSFYLVNFRSIDGIHQAHQ
jgi:hypothetical protein